MESLASRRFRILSDENRVKVLRALSERPHVVQEIVDILGIERTLVSHHLRLLREEGLVTTERKGKFIQYLLAPGLLRDRRRQIFNFTCCKVEFQ